MPYPVGPEVAICACMVTSTYRRRTPEDTLLHEVVREHLWEFFQRAEARSPDVPRYVRQAFYGYLDCGVLARISQR